MSQQLVLQATSEQLISEDWDKNLAICDAIAQKPDDMFVFFVFSAILLDIITLYVVFLLY